MPDVQVTAALLEAVFGWVAAGLTGVSAGALGAVGGVAAVGGYSLWAADNPDDAAEFEQYVGENIVSQSVGNDVQVAMNLASMPDSLKSSIIDYTSSVYVTSESRPVIPSAFPAYVYSGVYPYAGTFEGKQALQNSTSAFISNSTGYSLQYLGTWNSEKYMNGAIFFDKPVVINSVSGRFFSFTTTEETTYRTSRLNNSGNTVFDTTVVAANKTQSVAITNWSGNGVSNVTRVYVNGIDLGEGFDVLDTMSGVGTGLSTAFDNLVTGVGTSADVAVAGGVEAVYLPNVTIDTSDGTATVDDAYDLSDVTYSDVAITSSGGGTVPVPTDVLEALQQIITLLTPMGAITGIPPYVASIDTNLGTIIDEWPDVMDILDGLGLLPPIVQDIADGMDVIIDIPHSLEDITDILLPIPQSLQGLLDGVTIDIPQTLAQILNGTLSIPTAIDGVISGVAALPAAIAGALDIDWVLENTEELKDRLPDLDAPLILPQASFEDLKDIANDYKERTPLGKIFEAYEGTFDVMSTSPQGAPRYEFTFPSPINFSFVIDFAIFDGLFVQLAHAFFYLLAIFWYLKFIKRVKSWIDSWLTLGGGFAEVAEEESYSFRE